MKMQWYTVYTKPYFERKVSADLSRKKIENFFPINRIVEKQHTPEKVINVPLFNCYLFVRITEKQLTQVKKISGIVSLVYWLGKPVIINDMEIDIMKRFTTDHANISIEKVILGNEKVKRVNGLNEDDERPLISIAQKKIKTVLPSLGYILSAEIEASKVRIISSNTLVHQTKSGSSRLLSPVHSFYNFLKN